MSVNGGMAEIPPDIIAHTNDTNDTETIVDKVLGHFGWIGDKLHCLFKENLPTMERSRK
jgi:hypothetical protein